MNYKKVIEDYRNGTIDPEKWVVVMDNDGGYWSYIGDENEDEGDRLTKQMRKKYGEPCGYKDIVDVLNAAGVNCDWC